MNSEKKRKFHIFGGNIDLTKGPIFSSILRYALPIIIMGLLSSLYSAADSIVLGRFSGKLAFSAVGAANPIIALIVGAVVSINTGVSVLTARAFGSGDDEKTRKIVGTAFIFGISIGIFIAVIGELLAPLTLKLSDCPSEVYESALLYMRLYLIGTPAQLYYSVMSPLISSRGDSVRPLIYMTVSGLTNVTLNIILVAGFSLDVLGVGLATVISQYLAAILLTARLLRSKSAEKLVIKNARVDKSLLKQILLLGIPSVISAATFSLSNLQIQSAVNAFGQDGISGNAAASSLDGFVFVAISAMSAATVTAIAQNLGAGNKERLFKVRRMLYIITGVMIALLSWSVILLSETLLSIYISGEPEVLLFGKYRLFFILSIVSLYSIAAVNGGIMQAFGKTSWQMLINIIGICGLRAIWMLFIYPRFETKLMLYIAYPLSYIIIIIISTILVEIIFRKYRKQTH